MRLYREWLVLGIRQELNPKAASHTLCRRSLPARNGKVSNEHARWGCRKGFSFSPVKHTLPRHDGGCVGKEIARGEFRKRVEY